MVAEGITGGLEEFRFFKKGQVESRHFQETKQKRIEIYGCVGWNQFELRSYSLRPYMSKTAESKSGNKVTACRDHS